MPKINNITELVTTLKDRGEKLFPLNQTEMSKIEELNKKSLPVYYKKFLKNMGKSAGVFMKGSSVFYDEIFDLKEESIELLEENNFKKLPKDSFVFWMHQGYQIAFFILGESDNPLVYYYSEVDKMDDFKKEGTFIDFLNKQYSLSFLDSVNQ